MSKVDELPQRPTLPNKWIAANQSDLYAQYQESAAGVVQENGSNAHFSEWYGLMRQLGHVTSQRKEGDKQLVQKFGSDCWFEYEQMAQTWTLDYLRKCVKGR